MSLSLNISEKWDSPLLISGCARSGTSALARALSTHPRFSIFNEYRLYFRHPDEFHIWRHLRDMCRDNPPPRKVADGVEQLQRNLQTALPDPVPGTAMRNWLFASIDPPPLVYGDKMPYKYLQVIDEVAADFPEARFLVPMRDGRAVVASQIRQYRLARQKGLKPARWMKPNVQEAEYLWLRSAREWLRIRHDPPLPCLEVRYEEAVSNPRSLIAGICKFLDIQYQPQEFQEFFEFYRPVNTGTWKEELEDINRQLSPGFHRTLNQLGYD